MKIWQIPMYVHGLSRSKCVFGDVVSHCWKCIFIRLGLKEGFLNISSQFLRLEENVLSIEGCAHLSEVLFQQLCLGTFYCTIRPLQRHFVFFSASLIDVCYLLSMLPTGLVKTRMQAVARSGEMVYRGTYDAFSSIVRREGFRALYQGALLFFLWSITPN